MKLAIIGAGAMGTLFGGRLASTGNEVFMIDVVPTVIDSIRKNGIILEDENGTHSIKAAAYRAEDMANALLTGMALFNNIGHAVRMMYFSASDYVIPSEVQQGIFMMDGCFYLAAAVFLLSVVWISSKVNYVQAFFVAMPYI